MPELLKLLCTREHLKVDRFKKLHPRYHFSINLPLFQLQLLLRVFAEISLDC